MSIVIKGMDMPTSCSRCPCSNDASRFCRVVKEYIPMLGKPAFCPLVDVPDTNVGDMISRQAAIDAIEDTDWYHQNKNKDMVHGANSSEHQAWYKAEDVHKALEQLPSAQPERKKGEWLFPYDDKRYKKCSVCGREYYSIPCTSNYCPNYGADMRRENDE